MKKYLNILFVLCFLQTQAQTYFNKLIYTSSNGEYGASVLELSNGDYLIAGQNYKFSRQSLLFVRTNFNGDTLWTKEYEQPSYYYYGSLGALYATSDGNFIYSGSIADTSGNYDALLVKLNNNGDTLWTKKFGGPYFDAGRDCGQSDDGGYFLIMDNDSLNNSTPDYILIKTDSIGNKEWQRRYNMGSYEVPQTVQQTNDGGFFYFRLKGYRKHHILALGSEN